MQYRTLPVLLLSLAFVGGCTSTPGTSINQQNRNPLTASRYGDELADTMANLVIQNDPVTKEPGVSAVINSEISRGKETAQNARDTMDQGMQGTIIPMKESVNGYALSVNDTLYFSSDFESKPGPALHVYLTTVADPRDTQFPDKTAIDLGLLQAAYGPQQYRIPHQDKPELLRTIVLWDTKLKRLYGFGQLSKRS
ncbi:MAG: DM13 domain-containing protein [Candidatus Peribacteraceae bacterium]